MTLEEYYANTRNLKAPKDLDAYDRASWYTLRIKDLQKQLSKNDLQIVLDEENRWQKKTQ